MGSDTSDETMLCLRWNNSATKLNLSTAFQELRENSDFFDISLGCSDGSSGRSLRAHKVILSAYSSVFKDMLREHANRTDPFIFLKGVGFQDLSATLDFMYLGEVSVKQSSLNSFLAVAKELQVKGLAENIKAPHIPGGEARSLVDYRRTMNLAQEDEAKDRTKNLLKRRFKFKQDRDSEDIKPSTLDLKKYRRNDPLLTEDQAQTSSDIDDLNRGDLSSDNMKIESAPKKRKLSRCHICSKEGRSDHIKQHIRTVHPQSMLNEDNDPSEVLDSLLANKVSDEVESELTDIKTGTIDDFMEYIDKKVQQGSHIRRFAKCKICSKEGRSDNMKLHIRNNHKELIAAAAS